MRLSATDNCADPAEKVKHSLTDRPALSGIDPAGRERRHAVPASCGLLRRKDGLLLRGVIDVRQAVRMGSNEGQHQHPHRILERRKPPLWQGFCVVPLPGFEPGFPP